MQKLEPTSIIGFKENDVKEIVTNLSLTIKREGNKEFVSKDGENIAKCETCGEAITVKNLGSIAKGSNHLFCDNPICFITYLEIEKSK